MRVLVMEDAIGGGAAALGRHAVGLDGCAQVNR
jgi:hypothetical protein